MFDYVVTVVDKSASGTISGFIDSQEIVPLSCATFVAAPRYCAASLTQLGQLMARLMKLADEFNVAVLLTNQVQADPSG